MISEFDASIILANHLKVLSHYLEVLRKCKDGKLDDHARFHLLADAAFWVAYMVGTQEMPIYDAQEAVIDWLWKADPEIAPSREDLRRRFAVIHQAFLQSLATEETRLSFIRN